MIGGKLQTSRNTKHRTISGIVIQVTHHSLLNCFFGITLKHMYNYKIGSINLTVIGMSLVCIWYDNENQMTLHFFV